MLRAALELTAALADGPLSGLAWQEADGETRWFATGDAAPDADVRRRWIDAAAAATAPVPAPGDPGRWIAPVRDPDDDALLGVLVLATELDGARTARLTAPAARFLGLTLERMLAEQARATAYEALVEIGTQIQAQDVHADAVLEMIVGRARELCATDVAWLALVDDAAQQLRVAVTAGTTTEAFGRMAVRLGAGIGGTAVLEGRTIVVRDHELYGNGMPAEVHETLAAEGVVAVLCSPMLRAGRMVGALYVGMRRRSDFTRGTTSLLSALAAQAAIAIENGRLYRALAEKNDLLERSFAIHRELTDASLAGDGLPALGRKLAQLVGRDLTIVDATADATIDCPCDPDAAREPASSQRRPPADAPAIPIVADDDRLGAIHVAGAAPLSPLQRTALEHGATVIALELLKQRAALEVEWRLQGELLEEILRTEGVPSDSLIARARRFGVELDQPRRIAVLQPTEPVEDGRLEQLTRLALSPPGEAGSALVCKRGDRVVVAVPDRDGAAATARIELVQRKARRAGVPVLGGLSDYRTDLGTALREAEAALALAASGSGARTLVGCEQLGPLRFLLDAPDTSEMERLVRRVLGPLHDHDARRPRTQLVETLRAYLAADGHQPTTAAACHVHVSTLKYRLARITAVLDRSLADSATRFELQLAYAVWDVLRSLGIDPLDDEGHSSSRRDEGARRESSRVGGVAAARRQ